MSSGRRNQWTGNEEVTWTNIDDALDDTEDIRLEPIDPETEVARRAIREVEQPLRPDIEVIEEPAKFQFTLRHMLIANSILAVAFALLQTFAPSGLAGLLGIAVFFGGILLVIGQPDYPLVRSIWCGMLTMYVVFCAYALLFS